MGGGNKVEMAGLRTLIEGLGFGHVKSYINSGNVVFHADKAMTDIQGQMERAIKKEFGLPVPVLIKSLKAIQNIANGLPTSWVNNQDMKCDVMFLWPELDTPQVLGQLPIKPEIEDVRYVPGAILWRIDRQKVTKSKMTKIVGTNLYKNMTIRNCNTVRKLLQLMKQIT